jgi:predicted NBD/HSP70 family sugar kinase
VASDDVRRHNLGAVLDLLHQRGPLSRSQLARRTSLNRSTIADLIGELGRLGLVEEGPGAARSGPGRPSPVARVRPEGAVALCLELAVDSVAAATIGLGGHLYEQARARRPRSHVSPEETIENLVEMVKPLLAGLPPGHRMVGTGVAVAGVVRRSDGFVHLAPNLGWRNVPLGQMLAEALPVCPVHLANEADLGALAEYRRGAAVGSLDLVFVAGEVGLGAGIILEGSPMLGAAGYAGEVGHTVVNPEGRKCRCGARGCWETEAGEKALARRAGLSRLFGQPLIERLEAGAGEGDAAILSALSDTGRWLGLGLGNLVNIFNPDMVVVGGIYHGLFPFMETELRQAAEEVMLDAPGEAVSVVRAALGVDASLIGAGEFALSPVLADPAAISEGPPTSPAGTAEGA